MLHRKGKKWTDLSLLGQEPTFNAVGPRSRSQMLNLERRLPLRNGAGRGIRLPWALALVLFYCIHNLGLDNIMITHDHVKTID